VTSGTGRLKPSVSSPVLQYDSEPSTDFLAKILGVDTPLFLCSTRYYGIIFRVFYCCSLSLVNATTLAATLKEQLVAGLPTMRATRVQLTVFITMSRITLKAITFHLVFNSFFFFFYFKDIGRRPVSDFKRIRLPI
jgi:hypothetical protein